MKNPSEDIPKGTIRAIVLTYITYVGLLWIIGFTSLRCSDPDMNKCPTIADQAWATSVGTDLSLLPEGGLLYNKLIVVAARTRRVEGNLASELRRKSLKLKKVSDLIFWPDLQEKTNGENRIPLAQKPFGGMGTFFAGPRLNIFFNLWSRQKIPAVSKSNGLQNSQTFLAHRVLKSYHHSYRLEPKRI